MKKNISYKPFVLAILGILALNNSRLSAMDTTEPEQLAILTSAVAATNTRCKVAPDTSNPSESANATREHANLADREKYYGRLSITPFTEHYRSFIPQSIALPLFGDNLKDVYCTSSIKESATDDHNIRQQIQNKLNESNNIANILEKKHAETTVKLSDL